MGHRDLLVTQNLSYASTLVVLPTRQRPPRQRLRSDGQYGRNPLISGSKYCALSFLWCNTLQERIWGRAREPSGFPRPLASDVSHRNCLARFVAGIAPVFLAVAEGWRSLSEANIRRIPTSELSRKCQ